MPLVTIFYIFFLFLLINTAIFEALLHGRRVLPLDSTLSHLNPYTRKDYLICAIYDPFKLSYLSASNMKILMELGFFEERHYEIKDTWMFQDSWLSTKIFRYIFTNNLYVYTAKNMMTSATCLLPRDIKICEKVLEICTQLHLCCAIYSHKPFQKFEHVNINTEDDQYFQEFSRPQIGRASCRERV